MPVKKIVLPNIGEVAFYKRRSSRFVRLSFGSNGEVRVSLPRWTPYKIAIDFVLAKHDWICAHKPAKAIALRHFDQIGKAHRLVFIATSGTKITTKISGTEIRVFLPQELTSDVNEAQEAAKKASIRALKIQAQQLLPLRLQELASKHGFEYRTVGIRQLKARWGSCTSRQEITLNLFLLQLPWELIDYVLIHELVHTRVLKHGASFWEAMQTTLPNVHALKKAIAQYQPTLNPQNFKSKDVA